MEKNNEVKRTQIIDAWTWIRKNNNSIPDDILDLMKDAALQYDKLKAELESLKTDLDFSNEVKKECHLKIQQLEADNEILLENLLNFLKKISNVIPYLLALTSTDLSDKEFNEITLNINEVNEAIKHLKKYNHGKG